MTSYQKTLSLVTIDLGRLPNDGAEKRVIGGIVVGGERVLSKIKNNVSEKLF